MSAVVECPACRESLELPDEFMDGVICPHCEAAFILQPVLLDDLNQEPAAVAPGSTADTSEGSATAAATVTSGAGGAASEGTHDDLAHKGASVAEGEAAPSDASASSSGLRFAALAASGDRGSSSDDIGGGIAVAAAGTQTEVDSEKSDGPSPGDDRDTADDDAAAARDKTAGEDAAGDEADRDSHWTGLDTDSDETTESSAVDTSSMSAKAVRHRKKQGPGFLAHAIGVVGGGLVGLYLGYWLLNFFGGSRFYFVEIPLPFVEHAGQKSENFGDFPPPPGDGPITIEGPRSRPQRNRRPRNNDQGRLEPSSPMQSIAAPLPPEQAPSTSVAASMPRYSVQELADALTEADRATRLAGSEPQVTEELYAQLRRLAQVATFVDASEPLVRERREAVHTVLRRVTERPEQLAAVNAHAQSALVAAIEVEPAATQGIVFAGQVVNRTSSGPWQLTRVELLQLSATTSGSRAPAAVPAAYAASPSAPLAVAQDHAAPAPDRAARSEVTLVSAEPVPVLPGMSRLFVGSLIARPRQALQGYTAENSPVVWPGLWVTLASDAS